MKVVIAINSFKGSLSSKKLARSAKKGIRKVFKNSKIKIVPVADGGEGTIEALSSGKKIIRLKTKDPLGKKISSSYLRLDSHTALIESAKTIGLTDKTRQNILKTSTFGLGEMIKDAIDRGFKEIIITLGGTATNDAGVGMLEALGYRFYDKNSNPIKANSKNLINIVKIDDTKVDKKLKDIKFKVAVDVDALMVGKRGCSKVFSPQKGANKKEIKLLERGVKNFCKVIKKSYQKDISHLKGSGAGGCTAGSLVAFLDAKIISGSKFVLKAQNFKKLIKGSDIVITGEGKIDSQTSMGKAISIVSKIAKKQNIPVIAIFAIIEDKIENIHKLGIDAIFSIIDKPISKKSSKKPKRTKKMVNNLTREIFEVIKLTKKIKSKYLFNLSPAIFGFYQNFYAIIDKIDKKDK